MSTAISSPTAGSRDRRIRRRASVRAWSLSSPAVIAMVALAGVPLVTVIVGALSSEGIAAAERIVANPAFGTMLRNTVVWVAISLLGAMVVGYLAAAALNTRGIRLQGMWRAMLLIPWITPTVAAATAWKWVFGRDFGSLNALLLAMGVIDEPVSWLTDPVLVLPALALVQVWCTFPFVMLMVSSGLQSISDETREAASLDGASAIQTFRHIVLPALRDVTFILLLIVTVWALNSFVPVWVITRGGPAGSSTILSIELYNQFLNGNASSVSVFALLQLVVSMSIAALYVRQTRKD